MTTQFIDGDTGRLILENVKDLKQDLKDSETRLREDIKQVKEDLRKDIEASESRGLKVLGLLLAVLVAAGGLIVAVCNASAT